MHRFFVPAEWLQGGRARLQGPVAQQISRVLRLQPGAEVGLLDGSGKEYVARLDLFGPGRVEGRLVRVREGRGEPRLTLTLYQGLLKGEKLEWVLQKCTELGVATFVPVLTRRAVAREPDGGPLRVERWRRIVQEAVEQSGRTKLPEVCPPIPFDKACDDVLSHGAMGIIAWEREETAGLQRALSRAPLDSLSLFIGPEGGFDPAEVEYARSRGIVPVGLGPRILRAETAAVAVVAAVMYQAGEMG